MAYSSLSLCLPPSTPKAELVASTSSTLFTASSSIRKTLSPLPSFPSFRSSIVARGHRRSLIVGMAPEEEKMTRRSPLDFPIEWDRPKPGRRPDIFPQFSPMKTPLPPPMPADPEEDEEEDEEKKEEEEEDPEKEDPDKPDQ
ncbi:protein wings apart-like [Salvia splendens]|nr:protein wings apart-like [Salvia splendens]